MEQLTTYHRIEEFGKAFGIRLPHPHLFVCKMEDCPQVRMAGRYCFDFYHIYLNDTVCGDIGYGQQRYHYQADTLLFISPMQVVEEHRDEGQSAQGWVLMFDRELLRGTSLERDIRKCSFFSYSANEALRLLPEERDIVRGCFRQLEAETGRGRDAHTDGILVALLELLLNQCKRFYERQFDTQISADAGDVLSRFEQVMDEYLGSDLPGRQGLPTVSYCAQRMNYSPNYLSDLLRKETGKSASEHIQDRIVGLAKERLHSPVQSVSEVAYGLGFDYPQYFSRLFKKRTGVSPQEYRRGLKEVT